MILSFISISLVNPGVLKTEGDTLHSGINGKLCLIPILKTLNFSLQAHSSLQSIYDVNAEKLTEQQMREVQ